MNMYSVQPGYQGPTLGGYLNNSFSDVVIDWPVYCCPSLGEYCRESKTRIDICESFFHTFFVQKQFYCLTSEKWLVNVFIIFCREYWD